MASLTIDDTNENPPRFWNPMPPVASPMPWISDPVPQSPLRTASTSPMRVERGASPMPSAGRHRGGRSRG